MDNLINMTLNQQMIIYTSEIRACYATCLSHIHSIIAVPLNCILQTKDAAADANT